MSGAPVAYGAGGGGSTDLNSNGGAGGSVNAGRGTSLTQAATNGVANTGSGGGGVCASGAGGVGNGGSGVVIIRYPTGAFVCTGGTITQSGGFTIHTFTSNGTFTRTA